MKIRPVGAEGQTGRHDEANSHVSKFRERAWKAPVPKK
jgi:hypothetical protein